MIFYAYFFCCLSQNNYLCTLIFSLLLNMQSHPTWVRGLKLDRSSESIPAHGMSHPTWVRGLKPLTRSGYETRREVAPYVGAWIETFMYLLNTRTGWSHPTWVRGLKHLHLLLIKRHL